MNRKKGSISIAAIIILSVVIITSNTIHSRFISHSKALRAYIESENLTRRAEGVAIITKDRVIEATRILYDGCKNKKELKSKIEGPYELEYVGYIENNADIKIKGAVIDVIDDNIEQNGTDLYKFIINCRVYENGMDKLVTLNVALKNILKTEEEIKGNTITNGNNKEENTINNKDNTYNINDAIEFRIIRYN